LIDFLYSYKAMIQVLTALYWVAGIITFIGYFPTIKDLRQWKPSANLSTYWMRTFTMFITFLYALLVNWDTIFIVVVWLQLLACIIIFALRLKIK